MPKNGWVFVSTILLGAVFITSWSFFNGTEATFSPWLFIILSVITTLLRIFRVLAPGHRTYEGSTIGFFAGVLLLPLWQFSLLVIIAHLVEWLKERLLNSTLLRDWYIQPFNMAKCIISGAAVHLLMVWLPISINGQDSFLSLSAIFLSVVVYVFLNQTILGVGLFLARGISFTQAGILRDAFSIEMPLTGIGFLTAELMAHHPFMLPFLFAPVALIYQAFLFPTLKDEALASLEKFNSELTAANQVTRQVNDELFFTLAKVFDARDPFVGGHAAQVATYAVTIAKEMNLPEEQIEIVRQGAYLHDIGKIAIPEAILHKPSRLSDVEYEMVKRHCDIGADFLVSSHGLRHLSSIIRYHHERWDGKGYPEQLKGDEIPLESRILNVCDSVEAMASDRPYHRAMSVTEICAEVARCANAQFDPEVARIFIRIAEREGTNFVTNSARTVAALYASNNTRKKNVFMKQLSEIYGMVET